MKPTSIFSDRDTEGCVARRRRRAQPDQLVPPAHDAFTVCCTGWNRIRRHCGEKPPGKLPAVAVSWWWMISTLDKTVCPENRIACVGIGRASTAVVEGINLITLLWTDGDRHSGRLPALRQDRGCPTKNDRFRALLETAHGRGFMPECVVFDSWYSSLENLKWVRDFGWCG